jgi:exonuclease III
MNSNTRKETPSQAKYRIGFLNIHFVFGKQTNTKTIKRDLLSNGKNGWADVHEVVGLADTKIKTCDNNIPVFANKQEFHSSREDGLYGVYLGINKDFVVHETSVNWDIPAILQGRFIAVRYSPVAPQNSTTGKDTPNFWAVCFYAQEKKNEKNDINLFYNALLTQLSKSNIMNYKNVHLLGDANGHIHDRFKQKGDGSSPPNQTPGDTAFQSFIQNSELNGWDWKDPINLIKNYSPTSHYTRINHGVNSRKGRSGPNAIDHSKVSYTRIDYILSLSAKGLTQFIIDSNYEENPLNIDSSLYGPYSDHIPITLEIDVCQLGMKTGYTTSSLPKIDICKIPPKGTPKHAELLDVLRTLPSNLTSTEADLYQRAHTAFNPETPRAKVENDTRTLQTILGTTIPKRFIKTIDPNRASYKLDRVCRAASTPR